MRFKKRFWMRKKRICGGEKMSRLRFYNAISTACFRV